MAACVSAACVLWGTCTAGALDIVKGGDPVAAIVVPDRADRVAAATAAILARHVEKATGAALPVVAESATEPDEPAVHVGMTRAARREGFDPRSLRADGYFMRVKNRTLFLVGRDDRVDNILSFLGAKGTLVAALHFLHEFAGVRWLMPGPHGVWTPQREEIIVPDDLDRTYAPPFLYLTTRLDRYNKPRNLWSLANGARLPIKVYTAGGHTWVRGIPPVEHARTQPDLFAEIAGRRRADPNDKNPMLCTSHERFVPLMTAWIRSRFDEGYEIVQLGESDGYQPCECARCEETFGDHRTLEGCALRVLRPHAEIARLCRASHPGRYVMLLVYGRAGNYVNLLGAGKAFNRDLRFPPNVLAECTDNAPTAMAKIRRVIPNLTSYNLFWSEYLSGLSPKQSHESAARFMRQLKKGGAIGTYVGGGCANWPGEGATYYVALRAVVEPERDPDDLLREYCAGLYGRAADMMFAYYRLLYVNVRAKPDDGKPNLVALFGKDVEDSRKRDQLIQEKYVRFWPEVSLRRMKTLLAWAEEDAEGDGRALGWIRLARIGFEQVDLAASAYHAYRRYRADPSDALLREVESLVGARRRFVDRVKRLPEEDHEFTAEYFANHKEFVKYLDYEREGKRWPLGHPFDIHRASAAGLVPGREQLRASNRGMREAGRPRGECYVR